MTSSLFKAVLAPVLGSVASTLVGGLISKKPKTAEPVQAPDLTQQVETASRSAVDEQMRRARAASSTILTSTRGLTSSTGGTGKTILGG